jgi:hypothetical protein
MTTIFFDSINNITTNTICYLKHREDAERVRDVLLREIRAPQGIEFGPTEGPDGNMFVASVSPSDAL